MGGVSISGGLDQATAAAVAQVLGDSPSVDPVPVMTAYLWVSEIYGRVVGSEFQVAPKLIATTIPYDVGNSGSTQSITVTAQWGTYEIDTTKTQFRLTDGSLNSPSLYWHPQYGPETGAFVDVGTVTVPINVDEPWNVGFGPFKVPEDGAAHVLRLQASKAVAQRVDQRRMSLPRRAMVRLAGGLR